MRNQFLEKKMQAKMSPKSKKIFYIILFSVIAVVVILAITLGLVFGLKKDEKNKKEEEEVEIVDSYDNTDELIQKYPVNNPTPVHDNIEKKIQNRLLTGFENWNRGFKAWKKWGNILYTTESIYNVHGCRLSLEHYQQAMDISLQQSDIIMGDFHNMLIVDNYCAIHYDFTSNGQKSKVMEFVRFKDYGEKLGTRVEEGWGSTKDVSYDGLVYFQGDNEKRVQEEQIFHVLNYHIPDNEDDLNKKYPIKYKTTHSGENADLMLDIILHGFDAWNKGIEYYKTWVDSAYASDAKSSSLQEIERTMEEYKQEMEELAANYEIKKLFFDNILIRDDWAALHYRYTRVDKTSTEENKYAGDRMQFLKFQKNGDDLKIVASWIQ